MVRKTSNCVKNNEPMNIKVTHSFKTMVTFYPATQHHISQDQNPRSILFYTSTGLVGIKQIYFKRMVTASIIFTALVTAHSQKHMCTYPHILLQYNTTI